MRHVNKTQDIVKALYQAFNTPSSYLQSNFPALAARIEYLQSLAKGAPPEKPTSSSEGPQERDIDLRLENRRVMAAVHRLPYATQLVLEKSYTEPALNNPLAGTFYHLAGLIAYAQPDVDAFLVDHDPTRLPRIRRTLTKIWQDAHRAFEKEYVR